MTHLQDETNELRRRLMCEALRGINMKKGKVFSQPGGRAVTRNQIKEKIASESDTAKKANLEAALKELERVN